MKQPVPYRQVESWIESLPEWKSRLETMEAQLSNIPGLTQSLELVNIHSKGQKNEAVLNEVIRRLQLREVEIPLLRLKIQVLEGAIRSLREEENQFIEQRYINRLPNDDAMERLEISPRTFYSLRRRVLERIYRFTGGKDTILALPEDSFEE